MRLEQPPPRWHNALALNPPNSAAARNHVRRLPAHGTATSQYAARWLAETLSGSVKGPKRVPLSFRNLLPRADVVLPEDAANVFFAELQTAGQLGYGGAITSE